ncbi:hypothetical protein U3516DRAFT_369654 [Neocallimastix sp. 'constans']
MSNKERKGTRDLLNSSNFKIWKKEIYILLKRKDLEKYIMKDILNKIIESKLNEEPKKKLKLVVGTTDMYYSENTKKETIILDTEAKNCLMNSISVDLIADINFISSSVYEIYKLIVSLNQSNRTDRVAEIKEELKRNKYDPDGETTLAIFISRMNLRFLELSNLKESLDFREKFDYLYNAIPEELAVKYNISRYHHTFNKGC